MYSTVQHYWFHSIADLINHLLVSIVEDCEDVVRYVTDFNRITLLS